MRALRILALAAALAVPGAAAAWPAFQPPPVPGVAALPAQAFCGPRRCFARPFWRYRSGAGFRPFAGPGFRPARPFRFAPFGFRRFGGFGRGFRRF